MPFTSELVVVRHGDTEWAIHGRHTGCTDVALTGQGRREAAALAGLLAGRQFARVLVSPLQRAEETCRLAGFGDAAQLCPDLEEWNYGAYEGRTTDEILAERPGWSLWRDGVPGGETVDEVGERADRVIAEARSAGGDVALFAHGHVLRILAARWIGMPASAGQHLALDPAGVGTLGYEHDYPVIRAWNRTVDPATARTGPARPAGPAPSRS
ncbi:MAG TPA: histidine phosphatase family protein [Actinomycetota bacterium]|nr:histidine phosphatase family protein [Actinomycetota bacterium]